MVALCPGWGQCSEALQDTKQEQMKRKDFPHIFPQGPSQQPCTLGMAYLPPSSRVPAALSPPPPPSCSLYFGKTSLFSWSVLHPEEGCGKGWRNTTHRAATISLQGRHAGLLWCCHSRWISVCSSEYWHHWRPMGMDGLFNRWLLL